MARSVGPAQPPPGCVAPAGGRRTVVPPGAAAARSSRPSEGHRTVGRSGAAAIRPCRAIGRPSYGRSVRRGRHPAQSGRRETAARSLGSAQPHPAPWPTRGRRKVGWSGAAATRPVRAGGRPSHGRSVRLIRHPAPRGRREAVARSVSTALLPPERVGRRETVGRSVVPAQPPPGPVEPAGGRRTVRRSGATATRPSWAGGRTTHGRSDRRGHQPAPSDHRTVDRSGAAAIRPRRASGRPSHGRSVRRIRHPDPSGRLEAVAWSVHPSLPPPSPISRREAVGRSVGPAQPPPGPVEQAGGRRTVRRSGATATRPSWAGRRTTHGRSNWRGHQPAPSDRRTVGRSGAAAIRPRRAGGRPSHCRSVRRIRHPDPSGRLKAVARSVHPSLPPPSPISRGRPSDGRLVQRSRHPARHTGGWPSHGR